MQKNQPDSNKKKLDPAASVRPPAIPPDAAGTPRAPARPRVSASGAADADDVRRIVARSVRAPQQGTEKFTPPTSRPAKPGVQPRGFRQRLAVFLRNRQRRIARRKTSQTKRVVRRIALGLVILLLVLAGLSYAAVSYALSLIQRPGAATTRTIRPGVSTQTMYTTKPTVYQPPAFKGIQNILLLGVDDRREVDGETYNNSDVIMIVTVDMDNKEVKLTSMQRDMAVYLPGFGLHKLTESHGYGGADLTLRTLNENFRLGLTDYVAVDINESERLIDLVGGVDLFVDEKMLWYVNECIGNQNVWFPDYGESPYLTEGGMQHLNGRQAVGYARVRSYDSDYKRMGRQREVLQAVFNAFMKASLPQKISMITEGLKCIYTTLSDAEIRKLAVNVAPSLKKEIQQKQVPDPTRYGSEFIESSDYMIRANFNRIIPDLYEFLFNDRSLPFDPALEVPGAPQAALGLPPGIYDLWQGAPPQSTSVTTATSQPSGTTDGTGTTTTPTTATRKPTATSATTPAPTTSTRAPVLSTTPAPPTPTPTQTTAPTTVPAEPPPSTPAATTTTAPGPTTLAATPTPVLTAPAED